MKIIKNCAHKMKENAQLKERRKKHNNEKAAEEENGTIFRLK